MRPKDVCVIHREDREGYLSPGTSYRFNVTEFTAAGTLRTLHEGDWIEIVLSPATGQLLGYEDQERQAYTRLGASLVADGWTAMDLKGIQAFCRDTTVGPSEIMPLAARLRILDELSQQEQRLGLAEPLLKALRELRQPLAVPPSLEEPMLAFIHSLTELFRTASPSDAIGAQATDTDTEDRSE